MQLETKEVVVRDKTIRLDRDKKYEIGKFIIDNKHVKPFVDDIGNLDFKKTTSYTTLAKIVRDTLRIDCNAYHIGDSVEYFVWVKNKNKECIIVQQSSEVAPTTVENKSELQKEIDALKIRNEVLDKSNEAHVNEYNNLNAENRNLKKLLTNRENLINRIHGMTVKQEELQLNGSVKSQVVRPA